MEITESKKKRSYKDWKKDLTQRIAGERDFKDFFQSSQPTVRNRFLGKQVSLDSFLKQVVALN